jgi:N-carbamoyl-L-amino-acid hydrolase
MNSIKTEDLEYCEYLLQSFHNIGANSDGSVSRLGYTKAEDEMHENFITLGQEIGLVAKKDSVGNTFLTNNINGDYYLIGSHLDSVIDGGRFDGVAGVIAGLIIEKWAKEDNLKKPIKVGAFRCEESSNFGYATVGSSLICKEDFADEIKDLVGKDGVSLANAFEARGLSFDYKQVFGIKEYLELHIEQGRVLEESHNQIGIVSTIAGPTRFYLYLKGIAEHSGATPMSLRNDALCAAAEIIVKLEEIGNVEAKYHSVATVGVIDNKPNAMNVVPGEVVLGIDLRGVDKASIKRMADAMQTAAGLICKNRQIGLQVEALESVSPTDLSIRIQGELMATARDLGISSINMISGAGHDAMSFPKICDTGLVFIPCKKGISHNKLESTTPESIVLGARVIYEYIRRSK